MRRGTARRIVSGVASAGLVGLMASTSALAQCVGSGPFGGGLASALPFSAGTALSGFVATLDAVNSSSLAQSTAFVGTPAGAREGDIGSGVWVRGIGGNVEIESRTTTVASGGTTPTFAIPAGDRRDCNVTSSVDFKGYQAGFDIGRLNYSGGASMHFGVTAGYFDVKSKDKTPGEGFFSADVQVPFAGVYMAFAQGNFSLDAQARADFFKSELTDLTQGVNKQELDAETFAFLLNAAYRFNLANNWFIEPSIGGVWSRTIVNQFDVAGSLATLTGPVNIDDIDSVLGRASLRVGTTIVSGNVAWQPFVTGSVFREFAGNVKASTSVAVTDGINTLPLTNSITMSRVGTYGHVGGGLAAAILNTGWLGYARFDYRAGEDIEGWSVNAGIRYHFTPQQAPSGSLKDGGGMQHAVYNWSGPYIGAYAGRLHGEVEWAYQINGATLLPDYAGYNIGGQIGYNYQHGGVVVGIEGEYGGANGLGGRSCPNQFFFTCTAELESLGMVTGRVGLAFDRLLLYAKGGLAVGDVTLATKQNFGPPAFVGNFTRFASSETAVGWTAGGGVEFALTDRWSAKGEWMFYDLGKETFTVDNGLLVDGVMTGNTVRVGVNYHFGK